ncbi:SET domain-containing protein [Penicillium argentinense]|uniref:SET domain-containing protein n=1 Tax=Penicillium argentinense TaxID=1131581 RepID=A0A9W9KLR2_9EURO|nr:SET domain-containing protein [Penicillium argentinense]XP_056479517.1 SET domain-containing protein [Penicillium argentinense]KAJ5111404.1 SET domain-containing protein [Penicillium argentinense]KAJ5111447.1 SET domain-containing protein [Penicillium argentinense]
MTVVNLKLGMVEHEGRLCPCDDARAGYLFEVSGQSGFLSGRESCPVTAPSISRTIHERPRHKTVSGLRPSKSQAIALAMEDVESDNDDAVAEDCLKSSNATAPPVRQFHCDTRFPQRKRTANDLATPKLQPSSIDKFILGIWRQVHSPITLSVSFPDRRPEFSLRTGISQEVFRAINSLCRTYCDQSRSSRALEMIIQSYWVECFQARIASIRIEHPECTNVEARMIALKEACSTLGWQEKELRNRINRGRCGVATKKLRIRGLGLSDLCRGRIGFDNGLTTRLRHLAPSLEVAADTLHPGWRDLLRVVDQSGPRRYTGHPHEWVTVDTGPALPLQDTYSHLPLPNGFAYQFVEDCVIDQDVFGSEDPRRDPGLDPDLCQICKEKQSDNATSNCCSCFPNIFGCVRCPSPVQIFHTATGKNNGVVARCPFERGMAIAEFVGFITLGIDGLDVMAGGTPERPYQIFQGNLGNFTRFINHSCRPNCQFQRFYWCGVERVIVVSRGVEAGSEITVDYSDFYWRELKKNCLCGEPGCRFAHQGEIGL